MSNTENYKVIRLQLIDEITGEPLDYVNVRTNAASVNLSDGTFLEDVIKSLVKKTNESQVSEAKLRAALNAHLESNMHVSPETLSGVFNGIRYDKATGIVTFTTYDGEEIEWDTVLEKVALGMEFDDETDEIIFSLESGDTVRINIHKLVDIYEGKETDTTTTEVVENKVSVSIKEKAITMTHLAEEIQTYLTNMNEFMKNYKKYELPTAGPDVLGGVKIGDGIEQEDDGTISVPKSSNIKYGETLDGAVQTNLYMQIDSVGGPSTDEVPTMDDGKSYITSEGNIINYDETTSTYTYINAETGVEETGLSKDSVESKFINGLELVDQADITWYHNDTNKYAVAGDGNGFIYALDAWTFVDYISTDAFIVLINAGTLQEGLPVDEETPEE